MTSEKRQLSQSPRRISQRANDLKHRRARGVEEAKEAQHGTRSGYNRHLREKRVKPADRDPEWVQVCEECRKANTRYQRDQRASLKAAEEAS